MLPQTTVHLLSSAEGGAKFRVEQLPNLVELVNSIAQNVLGIFQKDIPTGSRDN